MDQLGRALPGGWSRLEHLRREAARAGTVRTHLARPSRMEPLLLSLARLHAACSSEQGTPAVIDGDLSLAFHREVARGAVARGRLRLHPLSLDGEPIAALYGFRLRRCEYYYLAGVDPRFRRLSPGKVLLGHALELAVQQGVDEVDFVRASERHDVEWGASSSGSFRRIITHRQTAAARAVSW